MGLRWEPLREKLAEARQRFNEGVKEIEDAFDGNSSEPFPLQQSPRIRRALKKMRAQFESLDKMHFVWVDQPNAHKYKNYALICIYNSALLHAVCGVHSWGWEWPLDLARQQGQRPIDDEAGLAGC
jgi:hypothetical protein